MLRKLVAGGLLLGGGWVVAHAAQAEVATDPATHTLEPVVVTAHKRDESVQDIASSVTVISGDELDEKNIHTLEELLTGRANLSFRSGAGAAESGIVIRGASQHVSFMEPSVKVLVDGMPVTTGQQLMLLSDVERVEILRGGQNASFGTGANAGAVNITTRKPDDERRMRLTLGAGNRDRLEAGFSASGALVPDQLYGRLSLAHTQDEGMVGNRARSEGVDPEHTLAVRGQLIFTPSAATTLTLTGAASDEDLGTAYLIPENQFTVDNPRRQRDERTNRSGGITIEHALDAFVLTAVTNYQDSKTDGAYLSNLDYDHAQTLWGQELRLSSLASGPWRWMGGLYIGEDKTWNHQVYNYGGAIAYATDLTSRNYELFGEIGYQFTERFDLLLASRFHHITRDGWHAYSNPWGTDVRYDFDQTDRVNTLRAVASYRIADSLLWYLSFAQGYKPSSPDYSATVTNDVMLKKETSGSWETGIKGGNRHINYALSVYQTDYEDYQSYTLENGTGPLWIGLNADEARSRGVEASMTWLPLAGLRLHAEVGYQDTHYRKFEYMGTDMAGNHFMIAPRWTGMLDVRYEQKIGSGFTGFIGSDLSYTGKFESDNFNDPDTQVDSTTLWGMRVGVHNERFAVSLIGKNLADRKYAILRAPGGWTPGERRTVMLVGSVNF